MTGQLCNEGAQGMDTSLYDYLKNTTLDAFVVSDVTGNIVDVNTAATAMYGYSRGELLSLKISDIELQDSHEQIQQRIANIIASGYERFESRHSHKDGNIIDVEVSVSFVLETNKFLAFHRDITEYRRNEEKLKNSEETYRHFAKLTSDYVHKCSRTGTAPFRIQWMGGSISSVCGYSQEEIFEKGCWLPFVHPDDRETISAHLFSLLPGDIKQIVFRLVAKQGDIRWVSEKSHCIAGEKDGELILFGSVADITEQRTAEEKLRETEELFSLFMRYSPVYTFIKQIEGDTSRVILLSDNFIEMLGRPANELRGLTMEEMFTPEFARMIVDDDIKVVNAGEIVQLEEELNGRIYTTIKFPILREGRDSLLAGFTIDISERKQMEDDLRNSQEMYRQLVDNLKNAVVYQILATSEGSRRFTYVSRAVERLNEVTVEEVLADAGKIYEQFLPEYNEVVSKLEEEAIKNFMPFHVEIQSCLPSGKKCWFEFTANPRRLSNGQMVWDGIEVDITERKHMEAALAQSHELMKYVIEHTQCAVAVHDRDLKYLYVSQRYLDEYKVKESDVIGKHHYDVFPDLPQKWRDVHQKALAGEVSKADEDPYFKADGSMEWTRWECRPWYEADGSIGGIIVYTEIITDRKNAEEERLKMEQQFLHAQKMESLGILAGGIAHDFNNILTAIVGNANLAKIRLNAESPAIGNILKIEQSATRAADLAKQMLAYSGKGKFVIQTIDLNRLINEMMKMLEVSLSKKVMLHFGLADQLPLVEVDATQIRQILMNLVINASEAIGETEGIIRISTGSLQCDSTYLHDIWLMDTLEAGPYVYLEIKDSGCGMGKEVIERLFDPFFTTKFTGRGLGMAAVLGIVRGHKGAITVKSDVGKGTVFKILIPAAHCSGESPVKKKNAPDFYGNGTVLLVDDEEIVRDIGSEMFKELGYNVVTASNGREALDVIKERQDIDLIILDLTMPHMDGMQCFRELRIIKPHPKVIMSSGYNEEDVTKNLSSEDLVGFIQKPYTMSDLKKILSKV